MSPSSRPTRRFGWISAIEGGAIFLAIVLLNAVHRPQFIAPVIAIIVGLHFFPLASLFGAHIYYATGSFGCTIGIAGLLISGTPDEFCRIVIRIFALAYRRSRAGKMSLDQQDLIVR